MIDNHECKWKQFFKQNYKPKPQWSRLTFKTILITKGIKKLSNDGLVVKMNKKTSMLHSSRYTVSTGF